MTARLQFLRLRLGLWTWRQGWTGWALPALSLSAAVAGWGLHHNKASQQVLTQQLQVLRAPTHARSALEEPQLVQWRQAQQALDQASPPDELLRRWAFYATQRGLRWQGAELQHANEVELDAQRVQLRVALRGTYPKLRAWIQDLLRDAPTLALERMEWVRAADGGEVDLKLNLSYWHRSETTQLPAALAASNPRGPR